MSQAQAESLLYGEGPAPSSPVTKKEIRLALIDLAHTEGLFRKEEDGEAISPSGVTVDEVSASFEDGLSGMRPTRDRSEWSWALRLEFQSRVDTESFEDRMSANPPRIQDHWILLTDADYAQGAQGGAQAAPTEVVFTFNVTSTPT